MLDDSEFLNGIPDEESLRRICDSLPPSHHKVQLPVSDPLVLLECFSEAIRGRSCRVDALLDGKEPWGDAATLPPLSEKDLKIIERARELKAAGSLITDPKVLQPNTQSRDKAVKFFIDSFYREQQWIGREQKLLVKWQKKVARKISSDAVKIAREKFHTDEEKQKKLEELAKKKCAEIAQMVTSFWQKQEALFEFYAQKLEEEARQKRLESQLMDVIDRSSTLTRMMIPNAKQANGPKAVNNEIADLQNDPEDMDAFLASLPPEYLAAISEQLPNSPSMHSESLVPSPVKLSQSKSKSPSFVKSPRSLDSQTSIKSPTPIKPGLSPSSAVSPVSSPKKAPQANNPEMDNLAKVAEGFLPTGSTYETTKVHTKVPSILDAKLRPYQHIGLEWLSSLFTNKLNGILADEMGLGKTVQTIAFLAHLAEEKRIWGPHLIVVPTSVLLNWEREFKRFCPSLKVLTYFGSTKERQEKRKGWKKPNSFNVCITSYDLYIRDTRMFKWRAWQCLVLDEAHNIKNSKSLRWNKLLSLRTRIRVLLTGTPLQNNLMELWSLLYFLMPSVFGSEEDFKNWFNDPMSAMIEGSVEYNAHIVKKLHTVIRPFILRRLKSEVEKQMPLKLERVVFCPLARIQRNMYNQFIRQKSTIDSIRGGSAVSVMNIVMQLRKCCNHPNLFYPIACTAPTALPKLPLSFSNCTTDVGEPEAVVIFRMMKADFIDEDENLLSLKPNLQFLVNEKTGFFKAERGPFQLRLPCRKSFTQLAVWNQPSLENVSTKLQWLWQICKPIRDEISRKTCLTDDYIFEPCEIRLRSLQRKTVHKFAFPTSSVFGSLPDCPIAPVPNADEFRVCQRLLESEDELVSHVHYATPIQYPDPRLVELDCGKLRTLSKLLRFLNYGGHRCLIFTQMSKMLDILEIFLTHQKYQYFRLDGSTGIHQRQVLMDRFNADDRIFAFILSTRSGGIGMNLTGADTVIFYDSDWNPTMDAQAQDRCHRIGQTRNVVIYRLISAHTIEENILKRATHKRRLGEMTLDEGAFTPQFSEAANVRELFYGEEALQDVLGNIDVTLDGKDLEKAMFKAEDASDVQAAKELRKEIGEEKRQSNDNFLESLLSELTAIEKQAFSFYLDEHRDELDDRLHALEVATLE